MAEKGSVGAGVAAGGIETGRRGFDDGHAALLAMARGR